MMNTEKCSRCVDGSHGHSDIPTELDKAMVNMRRKTLEEVELLIEEWLQGTKIMKPQVKEQVAFTLGHLLTSIKALPR